MNLNIEVAQIFCKYCKKPTENNKEYHQSCNDEVESSIIIFLDIQNLQFIDNTKDYDRFLDHFTAHNWCIIHIGQIARLKSVQYVIIPKLKEFTGMHELFRKEKFEALPEKEQKIIEKILGHG